ncbi:hypothetical protein BKA66DRAFT_160705 [Pyrenochaeta sp. MPI-SDFR-AT-0127]|nr:hypothetical protein BKA66DRAFT_160705 [Pyrenochaeta sp. MPI-SDFR-AT-0127]
MWSCSFLPGMQYTIYPSGSYSEVEAVCCYCNDVLVQGEGKVRTPILKDHLARHNFRKCNQRLYFSGQHFRQHLQDNHKTTFDATLFAGWTLLLKSSRRDKPSIFLQVAKSTASPHHIDADARVTRKAQLKGEDTQSMPSNFMDLTEIPQPSKPAKLRRKASIQSMSERPAQELRDSTQFFTRSATIDLAHGLTGSAFARDGVNSNRPTKVKLQSPSVSMPDHTWQKFYRRRVDASTRNRIYMRGQEEPLSKSSQQLFREIPRSILGGLVLHSSLIGAIPGRLTNSVDIYSLY